MALHSLCHDLARIRGGLRGQGARPQSAGWLRLRRHDGPLHHQRPVEGHGHGPARFHRRGLAPGWSVGRRRLPRDVRRHRQSQLQGGLGALFSHLRHGFGVCRPLVAGWRAHRRRLDVRSAQHRLRRHRGGLCRVEPPEPRSGDRKQRSPSDLRVGMEPPGPSRRSARRHDRHGACGAGGGLGLELDALSEHLRPDAAELGPDRGAALVARAGLRGGPVLGSSRSRQQRRAARRGQPPRARPGCPSGGAGAAPSAGAPGVRPRTDHLLRGGPCGQSRRGLGHGSGLRLRRGMRLLLDERHAVLRGDLGWNTASDASFFPSIYIDFGQAF